MLALTDPMWKDLSANYTDGGHVAQLLIKAESGAPLHSWYDELFQEIIHQYTVSEAAITTAPYLVRLAAKHDSWRKELMVLLGMCHAYCDPSVLQRVPMEARQAWTESAEAAKPLLLDLLKKTPSSESDLRYFLSALAGVSGYPHLARAIERLDANYE